MVCKLATPFRLRIPNIVESTVVFFLLYIIYFILFLVFLLISATKGTRKTGLACWYFAMSYTLMGPLGDAHEWKVREGAHRGKMGFLP